MKTGKASHSLNGAKLQKEQKKRKTPHGALKRKKLHPHDGPIHNITTAGIVTTKQLALTPQLPTALLNDDIVVDFATSQSTLTKRRRKRQMTTQGLFSTSTTTAAHLTSFLTHTKRFMATPAGDRHQKFNKKHPAISDEYYAQKDSPQKKNLFGIPTGSVSDNQKLLGETPNTTEGGVTTTNNNDAPNQISSSAFASTIISTTTIQVGDTVLQKLPSPAMFNIDPSLYQYIDDKSWLTLRQIDDELPPGLPTTAVQKVRDFQAKLPAPVHIDTCSILSLPKDLGGFGFEQLTFIQGKLLPMIASGLDILLRAPTSSGKTLAYAIPLVERLIYQRHPPNSRDIPILVLLPTRELALQTSATIKHLLALHERTHTRSFGVYSLVGGSSSSRVEQEPLMRTDIGFLVATTQRLTDHIDNTPGFKDRLKNTKMVVMDEVDYLMSQTGGTDIGYVLNHLNPQRQTIMLSATLTPAVRKVASFALRKGACVVDVVRDSIVSLGRGLSSTLSGEEPEKQDKQEQGGGDDKKERNDLMQFDEDEHDLLVKRQQKLVGEFVNQRGEVVELDHSEIVDKLGTGELVYEKKSAKQLQQDGQEYEIVEELDPISGRLVKRRRKKLSLGGDDGEDGADGVVGQKKKATLSTEEHDLLNKAGFSGADVNIADRNGNEKNQHTTKTGASATNVGIEERMEQVIMNAPHIKQHNAEINTSTNQFDAHGAHNDNTTTKQTTRQHDNVDEDEQQQQQRLQQQSQQNAHNTDPSSSHHKTRSTSESTSDSAAATKKGKKSGENEDDDDEQEQGDNESVEKVVQNARNKMDGVEIGAVSTYLKQNESIADELALYSDNDEDDDVVLFDEVNTNVQHFVQTATIGESLLTISRMFDDIGGRFLFAKQQVEQHNLRIQHDPEYAGEMELEAPKPPKIMVFCETARFAQYLAVLFRRVVELDQSNAFEAILELHSKKGQKQRTRVAQSFSSEEWKAGAILFSSDVAARGLDTKDVDCVVQIGMPPSRQQWIHRVGRVARDGDQQGISLTLIQPEHISRFAQLTSGLPIHVPAVGSLGLGVKPDKFNNTVVDPERKIKLSYKPVAATEFGELGEFDGDETTPISGQLLKSAAEKDGEQLLLEDGSKKKRVVPYQDGAFMRQGGDDEEEEGEDQEDGTDYEQNNQLQEYTGDGEDEEEGAQPEQTLWHGTIERAVAGVYLDRLTDEDDRAQRFKSLNEQTMSANTAQVGAELGARLDFALRKELGRVRKDEEMLLNAERAYVSYFGHHMALFQRSKGIQEKLKAVKSHDTPFKNKSEVAKCALEFAKGVGLCGPRNDLPPPAISPKNAERLGFDPKKQHVFMNIGAPTQFTHVAELQRKEDEKKSKQQQRVDHRVRRQYWEAKQRAISMGRPIPPEPKELAEQRQRRDEARVRKAQEAEEERKMFRAMQDDRIEQKYGTVLRPALHNRPNLVDFSDDEFQPIAPTAAALNVAKQMPLGGAAAADGTNSPYDDPSHPYHKQHQQFLKQQAFREQQAAMSKMKQDKKYEERKERFDKVYEQMHKQRDKKEPAPGRDLLKKQALYAKEPRRLRTGELDHKVHTDLVL